MFEKLVNSRLNDIADWIIRLILLNIMMIFFSLAIVTIYPALSAGYNMFSDYTGKKNPRLFYDFFKYFKEALGKKILLQLVIMAVFFVAFLNARYYYLSLESAPSVFLWIGYYISLGLLAIWFATMLYSVIVMRVRTDLNLVTLFKWSFLLAGKYYWITLGLVIITLAPFTLILFMNAFTMLLLVFLGLSLPMLGNVLMTRGVVRYLEKAGESHD